MTTKIQRVCGKTLERLRLASDLTPSQMGNELYVHGASKGSVPGWVIREYEAEQTSPTPQRLAAMATIFTQKTGSRVTVDSLLRSL
jgi:hypothetical protein